MLGTYYVLIIKQEQYGKQEIENMGNECQIIRKLK
jgi:hypothetical protein